MAETTLSIHRVVNWIYARFGTGLNEDGSPFTLPTSVVIDASDIQIGAVELKDGASDTRAKIKTDGTDNALVVTQNSSPLPTGAAKAAGAANLAVGQVTAGVASGVLVASRATRRSVAIRNQDLTNSAYFGIGTVTSGNGFLLKAGESISIDTTAAINCIRASADVAIAYSETYD